MLELRCMMTSTGYGIVKVIFEVRNTTYSNTVNNCSVVRVSRSNIIDFIKFIFRQYSRIKGRFLVEI